MNPNAQMTFFLECSLATKMHGHDYMEKVALIDRPNYTRGRSPCGFKCDIGCIDYIKRFGQEAYVEGNLDRFTFDGRIYNAFV